MQQYKAEIAQRRPRQYGKEATDDPDYHHDNSQYQKDIIRHSESDMESD
jgi:hypothetical protein